MDSSGCRFGFFVFIASRPRRKHTFGFCLHVITFFIPDKEWWVLVEVFTAQWLVVFGSVHKHVNTLGIAESKIKLYPGWCVRRSHLFVLPSVVSLVFLCFSFFLFTVWKWCIEATVRYENNDWIMIIMNCYKMVKNIIKLPLWGSQRVDAFRITHYDSVRPCRELPHKHWARLLLGYTNHNKHIVEIII